MKFTIEGLIGAGKSRLCDILLNHETCFDDVVVEPVHDWTLSLDTEAKPVNLLKSYYDNPERRAFVFQVHCLQTRLSVEKKHNKNKCIVFERGVEADYIFARINYLNQNMDATEWQAYLYHLKEARMDTVPATGRIYVKTSVDTCLDRIKNVRRRPEEQNIPREYMLQLEQEHDKWLLDQENVLILDGNRDFFDPTVVKDMLSKIQMFVTSF